ncbi:hypothetical protein EV193_111184 [Herbihabitans rhizosphaerae]|uniref:Uncharacterized protein n=1 Tax=Herbihabitans rhizosphaerae TaxID=1872711 RepID=A0A4V2ERQ8_9PSEU|nr:hypothetical protein [Herbihabitans rhizosphaerae]RZS32799.1 hypothetical protein EV193_111184 [Herbihabitans rhizosphaerae]
MRSYARVVAALAAVFYLVFGVWALVAPLSFAANIATYGEPNVHYLHDLGAFQIGIGVAALAGLFLADGLAAVLAGVSAGSIMHAVSHVVDVDLGGRGHDPYATGLIGLLTLVAFIGAVRSRAGRPTRVER